MKTRTDVTDVSGWPVFWFDTNDAWGIVDSPEAWAKMRDNWNMGRHGLSEEGIYQSTSTPSLGRGPLPNFGSRIEHIGGVMTLGEFFDLHGIDRSIGRKS